MNLNAVLLGVAVVQVVLRAACAFLPSSTTLSSNSRDLLTNLGSTTPAESQAVTAREEKEWSEGKFDWNKQVLTS